MSYDRPLGSPSLRDIMVHTQWCAALAMIAVQWPPFVCMSSQVPMRCISKFRPRSSTFPNCLGNPDL